MIRTKAGALRAYRAEYRKTETRFSGGLAFGIDFPTLRLVSLDSYYMLRGLLILSSILGN